jgi:hypothetical protein
MLGGDGLDAGLTLQAVLEHIQFELRTVLRHRKTPKIGVQLSGFSSKTGGGFFM